MSRKSIGVTLISAVVWATGALFPVPAYADAITVDMTADSLDGGDGLTSLREAFNQASANAVDDTITLAADATYDLTFCFDGALEHTAVEALTIEGNGATIHQACDDLGVIDSSDTGSLLSVNDVTIHGGPNTGTIYDGAAIRVDGKLALDGSMISGVDSGGGSILYTDFGAGVSITVTNSEITGNEGTAIRTSFAGVSVSTSTISDNTGSGVALVDGNPLNVVDTTITNNGGRGASTTGQGSTVMTLTGSTIDDNELGGINCSGCGQLTIEETNILDNGASATEGVGGGVSFAFDYDPVPVDPFITIDESVIEGNTARRFGGGIAVTTLEPASAPMTSPIITIQDSSISNNTTLSGASARNGGGLAIRTGSLAMGQTSVVGNIAGSGAGVVSAGGGLFFREDSDDGIADPNDLILGQVTFDTNHASGRGGGADIATAGIIEVHQADFFDNVSPSIGGGASIEVGIGTIDDSRFEGNQSLRGGGLFAGEFGSSNQLFVAGSTFAGNTATEMGGGIAADDIGELSLTNSTVSDNVAPTGGGISIGIDPMDEAETVVLRHATVAGNSAPVGANVVTFEGSLDVGKSVIAQPLGGGANCSGAPVTLVSQGRSFFSDASCNAIGTDTVSAANPQLGPLANNGGLTPTRLPAGTSPIGGLVPAGECLLTTDQRDVARPQGVNCEPGAVEIAEAAAAIVGTSRSDVLFGTPGNDTIRGLGGNDVLWGLKGDDVLDGGDGHDVLIGGPGNDVLHGGPGIDVLIGSPGTDIYDGGPGLDLCWFPGRLFPRDC